MGRTLLIGLDGATFAVLDALVADGVMPFLAETLHAGVRAELRSTPNPLTPPAWASVMTGRTPGSHGIFDFVRVEERGDEVYFTLNNFRDIRCETIFAIAARHDRSVTALNFPLTAPPPALAGARIVPGLVSWKHLRRNVHPPELYDELRMLPGFTPKDVAWDFELETKAMKSVPAGEYEGWVRFHLRREQRWFEIVRYMMTSAPTDLFAVLFDGADKLQHVCWRFLDPALAASLAPGFEREIRALCLEYFRQLDGYLAEIWRLAGPGACMILASDHGFRTHERVLRLNTWLHERGYLAWRDTEGLDEAARRSLERRMNSDVALVDWRRTTAWARTSASNGIDIRRAAHPGDGGVPPEEYEAFRARLTRELLEIHDPDTGEAVVAQVLTREEAFPGVHNRQAPDLTVVLTDGGFISIVNRTPAIGRRPEPTGTHQRNGIFAARGPGLRRGERIAPLDVEDVAAVALYSLGIGLPRDFEAVLPIAAFEPTALASTPPATGPVTIDPQDGGEAAYDAEDETLIAERLKALGYVE